MEKNTNFAGNKSEILHDAETWKEKKNIAENSGISSSNWSTSHTNTNKMSFTIWF